MRLQGGFSKKNMGLARHEGLEGKLTTGRQGRDEIRIAKGAKDSKENSQRVAKDAKAAK